MPRLFCIATFMICVFIHSEAQPWQLSPGMASEIAMDEALEQENHEGAFRIIIGSHPDSTSGLFPNYADLVTKLRMDEVAVLSLWGQDKAYITLAAKGKEFNVKSLEATPLNETIEEYQSLQNKPTVSKRRLQVVRKELFQLLGLDVSEVKHLLVIGNNPLTNISWASFPDEDGVWLGEKALVRISPTINQAFLKRKKPQPGHLIYGLTPRQGKHDAIRSIHQQFGGRMDRGEAASWDNYKQFAPLANFIHLEQACMTDGTAPALDRIIFSDSLLYLDDLPEVRLSARLAVVNGSCSGHTVQSISHAFAQAGCPSLIGSLWEVQGDFNEQILAQYYRNIKKGFSFEKALQKAQIAYLDTAPDNRKQPYYWAGLVLSGAHGKTESSNLGWFILLVGLVIFPLMWAWWKREKE